MAKGYKWLYVMLQLYSPTEAKGYLLKRSPRTWKNIDNCIADAKIWFETGDFDLCYLDDPTLIIEEVVIDEYEEN